jgi:hypothetical protein
VGIEPTTTGARCNPSLHHAANSSILFLPSLLRCLITRLRGTPIASRCVARFLLHPARLPFPGGISAHGLSGFEPEPFGLATEVTVNFTIPDFSFLAKPLRHNDLRRPCSSKFLHLGYSFTAKQKASATNRIGSKRLRRSMKRIDYGRVRKQSTRLNRLGAVSNWLLSSCLIFAFHAQ